MRNQPQIFEMTLPRRKMENKSKILVRDLNPLITCTLCGGYLVDATTLVDCLHAFCRSCILKYFENHKTGCPNCNTIFKKKSQQCFRPDPQIQSLVYKLVPGLYSKEMQRREDFYRSTGVRASSSCSDDSVLERERDMINDQEDLIPSYVGDKTQFFGPDDSISLSLEYYQIHLDTTSDKNEKSKPKFYNRDSSDTKLSDSDDNKLEKSDNKDNSGVEHGDSEHANNGQKISEVKKNCDKEGVVKKDACDKRFLRCPAAVSMKHLQKFIRMKYALTADHRVDIIYQGEVLPTEFSLMDVAYTFKWERTKPMRFFYRIFTPLKIRPIKIVNTTLSTGGKQLQIVPVKPNNESSKPLEKPKLEKAKEDEESNSTEQQQENEDQKNHKERLFAHLQLQSKTKVQNIDTKVPEKEENEDCVLQYEEPDKEEIKRFAEKRDREWAMQKKLDETRQTEEYVPHHSSKKRKKNKHSKNEFLHKKRKLHAEITSNEEEDLKLKVKITTPNGHKHKHHKSEKTNEMSSKEKLLQMRQVRHKHVSSEDKNIQTVPSTLLKLSKETGTSTEKIPEKKSEEPKQETIRVLENVKIEPPLQSMVELKNSSEAGTSNSSPEPFKSMVPPGKTLRSDFTLKTCINKEWGKKVPTVHIERNQETEKQAQKTFLKTFQSFSEKYHKNIEKIQQNKIESAKLKMQNNLNTNNKTLEQKMIASLQQHCTIEAKPSSMQMNQKEHSQNEKKINFVSDKPHSLNPQYPSGFTVSKIEAGMKRKIEELDVQDKRPSLEITLINPPSTSSPSLPNPKPAEIKAVVKRPPPATIPLERIKKSVNLGKSGISIIPKLPEKCDNIGALDLSKPNKSPELKTEITPKPINGFNLSMASRQLNNATPRPPQEKTMQLSNLQMLSKVATEHQILNHKPPQQLNNINRPRPQIPNLIPSMQNPGGIKTVPNLQKMPKLNEMKFRPTNPQIRNLRPNQNQNIRNIPNPSLLVKQQNQNRLNSINCSSTTAQTTTAEVKAPSTTTNTVQKDTSSLKTTIKLDTKVVENKEISV